MIVDNWGNCWDPDDEVRNQPVMAHPELSPKQAVCSTCGGFFFRVKKPRGFEWHCQCGIADVDHH